MKYDKTYILCFLFVCLLFQSSCKSHKEITRTVTDQTRVEQIETAIDTTRTLVNDQENVKRQSDESEEIYTRTKQYDSLGNIRTIQETWRAIGRTELALHERSGSYISLNGMSTITAISDSSTLVINDQENSSTDTRPLQGTEWIWAIIGAGLLLFIIIMFVIKR